MSGFQLDFEWFVLLLRLLFVFLLYFFLFQVVRVTTRELIALASQGERRPPGGRGPAARLVVVDGAPRIWAGGRVRAAAGDDGRPARANTIVVDEPFLRSSTRRSRSTRGAGAARSGEHQRTFVNGDPVTVATASGRATSYNSADQAGVVS
jgi:hypothetical protein